MGFPGVSFILDADECYVSARWEFSGLRKRTCVVWCMVFSQLAVFWLSCGPHGAETKRLRRRLVLFIYCILFRSVKFCTRRCKMLVLEKYLVLSSIPLLCHIFRTAKQAKRGPKDLEEWVSGSEFLRFLALAEISIEL
jgi:hypothetical protein